MEELMKKWTILFLAVMLMGMIFWSCSEDSTTAPDDNNNAVLQDNGVIINYEEDFSNLESSSIDMVGIGEQDTLVFTGTLPANLEVGKSFVATDTTGIEPVCLIRTVESVWTEGDNTYAETKQCGLGDVFEEYEFTSTADIDLAQMVLDSAFLKNVKITTNAESVTVTEITKGEKTIFEVNLQDVVISAVPLVTADIIMTLEDIDVELSARWKEDDHFIEAIAHVVSSAEVIINCNTNINLNKSIPLTKGYTTSHWFVIPTPVGPIPIPYTVNIGLGLTFSGSAGAGFSVGGGVATTLDVSFSYDDGVWDKESNKIFEPIDPTFEASHALGLSVSVGPSINILIAGVAGPQISAGPFVEGEREFNYTESKIYDRINIGLQAGASIVFSVFGIEGLSLSYSFPAWQIWSMNLYENITDFVENTLPVIDSFTASASSVEQGGTVNFSCSASDGDDDNLTYSWARTGGSLSTTTGTSTIWTAPMTSGSNTITCTVSDGKDSASKSETITVTDSPDPGNMVYIQGGTFQMGNSFGDSGSLELPVHSVTVSDFYMGEAEVTQAEWAAYMTVDTYDYGTGNIYPVYYVSFYEIVKYCNLRSMAEELTPCYTISSSTDPAKWGTVPTYYNSIWDAAGCDFTTNGYRLPTEAEWEYAARGGLTEQRFPNGATISHSTNGDTQANYVAEAHMYSYDVSPTEGHHPSYNQGASPVGSFPPNGYGLYDMSGNVMEWCWDWCDYYTSNAQIDPIGPDSGPGRGVRGGRSWSGPTLCQVSYRGYEWQYWENSFLGFRVVKSH